MVQNLMAAMALVAVLSAGACGQGEPKMTIRLQSTAFATIGRFPSAIPPTARIFRRHLPGPTLPVEARVGACLRRP